MNETGWKLIIALLGVPLSLLCTPHIGFTKESCVSAQCHQTQQASTHPKDESCDGCHIRIDINDSRSHPVDNGTTFTTQANCSQCHQHEQEFLHPPVAAGDCAACHLAHGSAVSKRLKKNDESLCMQCHLKFMKTKKEQWHITDKGKNTCLFCHEAHGNRFRNLLTYAYSDATYISYESKAYALCFSCHKRNLLRFPDTRHYTNFRDGQKNLHYLHVNKKEKGKNCTLCHEVHESKLGGLMAEDVPFGTWSMPLNHTKQDPGGRCVPGCHQEQSYDPGKSSPGSTAKDSSMEKSED